MSIVELKQSIHQHIDEISDEEFLESLYKLLEQQNSGKEMELSEFELKLLDEAVKEVENGHYYTDKEANKIVKDWLKD